MRENHSSRYEYKYRRLVYCSVQVPAILIFTTIYSVHVQTGMLHSPILLVPSSINAPTVTENTTAIEVALAGEEKSTGDVEDNDAVVSRFSTRSSERNITTTTTTTTVNSQVGVKRRDILNNNTQATLASEDNDGMKDYEAARDPPLMPSSQNNNTKKDGEVKKRSETIYPKDTTAAATTTMMTTNKSTTRRLPLILGAGRGTTGTHAMTEAMCALGYPSIHYNVGCVTKENMLEVTKEDGTIVTDLTDDYSLLFTLSEKIRVTFTQLGRCILRNDVCPNGAQSTRDSLIQNIDALVNHTTTMDVIPTFHDIPYTNVMPSMIKVVKKYYNGSMPGIVLTERDPEIYVTRRVESMHAGRDIICKTAEAIDPETLENGAFDFVGCIDRALSGMSEEEAKAVRIGQIFTSIGKLYNDETSDEGAAFAKDQVKEYQDAVRSIADFSVDLFVREGRVASSALKDEIISSADVFQSTKKTCDYMNFWTRQKLDSL